jgi:hypothetical protein
MQPKWIQAIPEIAAEEHRVLRDDNKTTGSARPHVSQGERGKIHTVKKDAPACERFHEAKECCSDRGFSWAKGTRAGKGD